MVCVYGFGICYRAWRVIPADALGQASKIFLVDRVYGLGVTVHDGCQNFCMIVESLCADLGVTRK